MITEFIFHYYLGWFVIILGIITILPLIMGVVAPYGRFSDQNKGRYGPLIPAKVGWVVMESPASLMMILCLYIGIREGREAVFNPVNIIFMCLFLLHYINRAFVYPFRMKGGKPMPIGVTVIAFLFCFTNGYLQGTNILRFGISYPSSWILDPRFILGVTLFLGGWYLNKQADNILANLRKPGETSYKIPYGGLFDYVSSANYTAELLEWGGWALATWSLAGFAFFFYTGANLIPRARDNHEWYLKKFRGEYPKNRKIVIPFIY